MIRPRVPAAVRLAILAALVVVGCVPQPAGRSQPPPSGVAAVTPRPVVTPSGPTPTPSFRRPTPTPRPTFLAYRVRTGDTLISIARRFETTTDSIAYWNRLTYPSLDPDSPSYRPNDIRVGWTLLLVPNDVVDPEDLPPGPGTPEPAESGEPGEPAESVEPGA